MRSLDIHHQAQTQPSGLGRLRHAWIHSLRFRLLWLGLMPPILALPLVLIALGWIGGAQLNSLIEGQLNSNLSSAQNYLQVFRTDLQARVTALVRAERFGQLVQQRASRAEISQALQATLRGSEFDVLLMVNGQGLVIGSSQPDEGGTPIPPSYVIQQAQVGLASSGFEQFVLPDLARLSPSLARRLLPHESATSAFQTMSPAAGPRTGTLILAAAHLPLSVTAQDVVLVGAVLINDNTVLIEHLREIIYPAGRLPYDAEGFAGIFAGRNSLVHSRLKTLGNTPVSLESALISVEKQAGIPLDVIGTQKIAREKFALAVAPILGGDNTTIAHLAVGFPISQIQNTAWLLLAALAALLGLVMLAVSVIYLRAGRQIVLQLTRIARAMNDFRNGNRSAQIHPVEGKDELGLLSHHVNDLLGIVAKQEKDLRQLALHDALTGLGNRQSFTQRMTLAMATSERTRKHGAMIMLDLDNFKPLNDLHGHPAGDQLLIQVGERLQSVLREVDTVARFGGDEFMVLLESLSEDRAQAEVQALEVGEKIRAVIDRPFHILQDDGTQSPDIVHHCTSSVGVTLFLGKRVQQDQLLIQADTAMYEAKSKGKNCVSLYGAG